MTATGLKERARATVDALAGELTGISLDMHAHPEVGYEEHHAAEVLSARLESAGFAVRRGVAGLKTAFVAEMKGRAERPRVALLGELDALPGLGHACGHNIIATAGLGAALALGPLMREIGGSLVYMGTPAEEKLGGKVAMVEAGLFDDVDAALMIHPGGETRLGRRSLAATSMEFIFHGRASHATVSPDKGINALDACIALFNGTNALKKHLRDDARLHGVIFEGGAAANIVPERARAVFSVRAADRVYLETVITRTRACAEAAAAMAGARVEINAAAVCTEMNASRILADLFRENAVAVGHDALPLDMTTGSGSTDMANVSQVVPTIQPSFKIGDSSLSVHTAEFREAARAEPAQHAMLAAAKIMAMTAIDVWTVPGLPERLWREFREAHAAA